MNTVIISILVGLFLLWNGRFWKCHSEDINIGNRVKSFLLGVFCLIFGIYELINLINK